MNGRAGQGWLGGGVPGEAWVFEERHRWSSRGTGDSEEAEEAVGVRRPEVGVR